MKVQVVDAREMITNFKGLQCSLLIIERALKIQEHIALMKIDNTVNNF